MRTISGTVSTREQAETARRRLEALGIDGDRIGFKEVGEPGPDGPGIFVTVKVAPEQVEAATDILKGGGPQAREPAPVRDTGEPRAEVRPAAPHPSQNARVEAAPPRRPFAATDRSSMAAPVERVERRHGQDADGRGRPAKDSQPGSVRLARMAAIAALLAGLGFAAGAALGILV